MNRSSFLRSIPFICAAPMVLANVKGPEQNELTQDEFGDYMKSVFPPPANGKKREFFLAGARNHEFAVNDVIEMGMGDNRYHAIVTRVKEGQPYFSFLTEPEIPDGVDYFFDYYVHVGNAFTRGFNV